jgi:hypothetical protein
MIMANEPYIAKIPENTSILQLTKFTVVFPTLSFLKYFSQTMNLPGVSTTAVEVPSPFSSTFRHGDKLVYETFSVNAIIDEEMRVWEETYSWLRALTKPTKFSEYKRFYNATGELYHDAILTVNTNANLPNIRFKFKNIHPVSLGGVAFNTSDNAQSIPTADVTFRYDFFEIERL